MIAKTYSLAQSSRSIAAVYWTPRHSTIVSGCDRCSWACAISTRRFRWNIILSVGAAAGVEITTLALESSSFSALKLEEALRDSPTWCKVVRTVEAARMKGKRPQRRNLKAHGERAVRASISFPPLLCSTLEHIARHKKL
jgi:hypothetical protein